MKAVIPLALVTILSGCATMQYGDYDRESAPDLYSALDSAPDGYEGRTADGVYAYEIVSTLTDGNRLCRVVNLSGDGRFHTESFCKVRGGEWR